MFPLFLLSNLVNKSNNGIKMLNGMEDCLLLSSVKTFNLNKFLTDAFVLHVKDTSMALLSIKILILCLECCVDDF